MKKSILKIAAFGLIVFLISSCSTPINEVVNNLDKYENKEVTIKGKVISTTNIAVSKFYQLQDETGEIRVFTENSLPNENDEVTVTGKVKQYFKISNVEMIGFEEIERK